jgi:hypothetical protein
MVRGSDALRVVEYGTLEEVEPVVADFLEAQT